MPNRETAVNIVYGSAITDIDERTNRILNIIKAKHGLKTKVLV
ncbi:MAG: DUF2683 family protein [Methanosarcina sp.]|nr:DUF2683 family protein [Methanosarcina sp.]MDW5552247.1 DUF2683 family protein [Methanosarcina sp.]MDW5555998.1 DUF2683 family protein [Methanosarcina sp.]MDW5561521.1 DUF2683 family protein [Methanosarcina sp.]